MKRKNRNVHFIDVERRCVAVGSIETLFAQDDLNSPQVEQTINELIETPLARYRDGYNLDKDFQCSDIGMYRALRLFFAIQYLRFAKAKSLEGGVELDNLLGIISTNDPGLINSWAANQEDKSKIITLRLGHGDQVFYPESGFFFIPTPVNSSFQHFERPGLAFPLSPSVIVCDVPNAIDLETMRLMPLSCYSTGKVTGCNRYIVPRLVRENQTDEQILEEFFRLRQVTDDAFVSLNLISELHTMLSDPRILLPGNGMLLEWQRKNEKILNEMQTRQEAFSQSDWGKRVVEMVEERNRILKDSAVGDESFSSTDIQGQKPEMSERVSEG